MKFELLVLGESLELLIDNRGKNPPYSESGIPAISGVSVSSGTIDFSSVRYVDESTWASWMPNPTRKNDVILTSEAPLGRVALVPDSRPLLIAQRLFGLRGRNGVLDSRFLYYSLQTAIVQADLQGRATGTTVLGIRQPALLKVQISAPSYPEQQAIAEVLEALDHKIAANSQLAKAASALASLSFDIAMANMAKKPMSQVLRPVLGATPSRSRPDLWVGEHLWISAKDVTGAPSGVVIETEEKISATAIASTRAKPLPTGSVILTARGTVGAVARLGAPSSFNQSCYGFVPGQLPAGVLYFAIQRAADQARSLAHGSVFDTITMKTFDHVEVPNPESAGIRELNAEIEPLLDVVTASVLENRALAATRDTLLPQLLTGKLRVRDAEKIVAEAV